MPALSVFIITLNEEKNIRRCLESVRWADEIVVVDSGSIDNTVTIASEYTKLIHVRTFTDYADQKNHALSLATGDWCLSLDADEEVTPALRDEIQSLVAGSTAFVGYRIPRRSVIFGRKFNFTGTQNDKPMRLFKKGTALFCQPIHETVRIDGTTTDLRSSLNHLTYTSISSYMQRLNRYTTLEADFLISEEVVFKSYQLKLKPLFMGAWLWIVKRGFQDGLEGFFYSVFSAYYVFLKHAKHWEKTHA